MRAKAISEVDAGTLSAGELGHELGLLGPEPGVELTCQVGKQAVPSHTATVGQADDGSSRALPAPRRHPPALMALMADAVVTPSLGDAQAHPDVHEAENDRKGV